LSARRQSLIIADKENAVSDNPTQDMPDSRSFEERVFARFDSLDARLSSLESKVDRLDERLTTLEGKVDGLDGRLAALEEKVDARLRETRSIWEAMQVRLENIGGEVKSINRRLRVLHEDILNAKEVQEELRERIEKLESEPTR
jgi:chromosome segregation ATPase